MSDFESEFDENKLPSGLNVLTILTFIGSTIGILSGIFSYLKSADNLAKMEEMVNKPEFQKFPDFVKKMYSPEALDLLRKVDANKLPILIITILSSLLCLYGAIEMRTLKKSGFYTYIVGSVVPYLGYALFVGISFITTGWGAYFGIAITTIFIALYANQAKFLTKK